MITALRRGSYRLRELVMARATLLGQAGWVTASFGAQQVIRLALSIALAWLLAPELLGVMLLLNTFRTGAELLSDIGIGQNIIRSPNGENQDFLNTAWTLQIFRGIALFAVALIAAIPLADFFGNQQLKLLIPVVGILFIIIGSQFPSKYVLIKRMELKRYTYINLWTSIASAIIHIILAIYIKTIWALILGLLLSAPLDLLNSWLIMRGARWRLAFHRQYLREILSFGKWIFVSSFVYFLSLNFDRLYFGKVVAPATLGVYGIARTYADTAVMLAQSMASQVVFPRIASSGRSGPDLQRAIANTRGLALAVLAVGLSFVVVFADAFVLLLYDHRYHDAAVYVPVLMFGAWFTVLSAFAESMMLGVGLSRSAALANGCKLAWIVITVPLSLHKVGMAAAPFAFVAGDMVRYGVLVWQKRKAKLSFIRHDVALTLLFIGLTLALRELSYLAGLTSGITGWIEAFRTLHS